MLHVVVQRFHELLGRWRGVFLQQSASLLVQIGEDAPRLVDVAATEVGACGLELERGGLPRFVGRDFTRYLACGVLAPRLCPAGLPDLPGRGARPLLLQVPRGVPLLSGSSMFRAGGDA